MYTLNLSTNCNANAIHRDEGELIAFRIVFILKMKQMQPDARHIPMWVLNVGVCVCVNNKFLDWMKIKDEEEYGFD